MEDQNEARFDMILKILNEVRDLIVPAGGGHSVRIAILFAAFAVVTAIVVSPWLDTTAKRYARDGLGVDLVVTSTTEKTERYTVRRSVLDDLQ